MGKAAYSGESQHHQSQQRADEDKNAQLLAYGDTHLASHLFRPPQTRLNLTRPCTGRCWRRIGSPPMPLHVQAIDNLPAWYQSRQQTGKMILNHTSVLGKMLGGTVDVGLLSERD